MPREDAVSRSPPYHAAMPPASQPIASAFELHGNSYQLPPQPVVAVCIDGCAEEYLDEAFARGRMPRTLAMLQAGGVRLRARGALPSFTNVNNACVVTGVPPSVTGIAGNYFLDPATGEEVMMNSPDFLRCETILARAAAQGRRVAMVTAKDKLRRLLSRGYEGINFSAERAGETTLEEHGIDDASTWLDSPVPDVYSGELSLFVLRAGAKLLEEGKADFLYLTLSDFVQHKHAPDEREALQFYAGIDDAVGRFLDAGAVVGITADHGMSGKSRSGRPNVVWLESELTERFGSGLRVICTITDPYVVHHGALGSFVAVHLEDLTKTREVADFCLSLDGITEVYDREGAASKLELPADRIGDLAVLSARDHVIGRTPQDHDLDQLGGLLRSHGGRYEEMVPLLTSTALTPEHREEALGDPRSFDLFRFLCCPQNDS